MYIYTVSILYKLPFDCGSPLYSKSHAVLSAQQLRYIYYTAVMEVVVAIAATQTSSGCYIRSSSSSPRCVALKLDNPRWYKHLCFVNFRAPRSANSPPKTSVTDNRSHLEMFSNHFFPLIYAVGRGSQTP